MLLASGFILHTTCPDSPFVLTNLCALTVQTPHEIRPSQTSSNTTTITKYRDDNWSCEHDLESWWERELFVYWTALDWGKLDDISCAREERVHSSSIVSLLALTVVRGCLLYRAIRSSFFTVTVSSLTAVERLTTRKCLNKFISGFKTESWILRLLSFSTQTLELWLILSISWRIIFKLFNY